MRLKYPKNNLIGFLNITKQDNGFKNHYGKCTLRLFCKFTNGYPHA